MIQTRKSKETTAQWDNRNILLDEFFQKLQMDVILIGDPNIPAVVHNYKILACYVHNYTLHFMKKCDHGREMYRCRVDAYPDPEKLLEWYLTADHDKAFRVRVKNTNLFICGTSINTGRPVFGEGECHYYRDQDFAQHLIDKFDLHYCEIV